MRGCKFFFMGVLLMWSQLVYGQETSVLATNPPSVKWNQINTPNFRIIFPQGFDFQAQRMANTLEQVHAPEAASLGRRPKKISIILQNQTAVSNGFVALAPRRSEFYTMPTQDNQFVGNNDWLNLLATHEYRHIVQFQNSVTGFNKAAYYLFGQQFLAGLSFAAVPNWFWEGDAVATETAFTRSGRGRIPSFDLLFRTNLLEGRNFNYHKQYLRSYKHNIPNHYVIGYEMVSYLRKKTGNAHIWGDITQRAWSLPFVPFTFSSAIKRKSGLYVRDLYNEMMVDLQKQWTEDLRSLTLTPFESLIHRTTQTYTDYKYPQPLEDGSILVQKSGIGDITQLVRLKDGKELTGYVQGQVNDAGMLSAVNARVVWNEYRYDRRWQIKNYSVIKGFDFGNHTSKIISKKSKYNSAALSPDGSRVATVETDNNYFSQLLVLDYFTGKVLKVFSNPSNDFISMPRFAQDGLSIIALKTNAKGKSIVRFDIESGNQAELCAGSDENIGYPVPFKNYIFYNSPYSGIDNIYALDIATGNRYQVTCAKYGAYYPAISPNGETIYYNEQTRNGLDVVKIPFDPACWVSLDKVIVATNNNYQHLVEQEGQPNLLDHVPQFKYEIKRYYRASGFINPHSWGPYFLGSLTNLQLGISSQDILSTMAINAGYNFDVNERIGAWKTTASYQGWLPIIDVSASLGERKVNEGDLTIRTYTGKKPNYALTTETKNLTLNWKETNVEIGVRIPLNLTTSKYFSSAGFSNSVGATQVSQFTNSINSARIIPTQTVNDTITNLYFSPDRQANGTLAYNHLSFSASRLLKTSRRDIYSRWGQSIYLDMFNTPFGGEYSGNLFAAYGIGFFPGLFKHHSIWGYWGYQNSKIDNLFYANKEATAIRENYNYQFKNQIPLPRGGLGTSRFAEFYSMSANYTMPIWYPDFSFGPLLNIQRIRTNFFFDYGYGRGVLLSPTKTQTYMSTGIELKADINVMRFLPQFNVGVRVSAGIKPSTSLVELLIGNINF